MTKFSTFAETIYKQKYSHELKTGELEVWDNIAYRVSKHVLKAVGAPASQIERTKQLISERKFIPGGRYLYATGRPYHQVNNCFLFRADDSREGWADLMQKATMALMSGGGIGTVYSDLRPKGSLIRKTGGFSTGPCSLMQMQNEAGRFIMQGGSRRCAIWAGLHWSHQDVMEFAELKNWSEDVRDLKAKDFNFPAPMDMTNISIILDDEFFEAYNNPKDALHASAQSVYWTVVRRMLKTGEPGFSIDTGDNANENLRNAPICAETHVLTDRGYFTVENLIGIPATVWTGKRWAKDVLFQKTNDAAQIVRVEMSGGRTIRCDKSHEFFVERYSGAGERRRLNKVEKIAAERLQPGDILHISMPGPGSVSALDVDAYTLGYVYGDGSFTNGGKSAEITICTEDKKPCLGPMVESGRLSSCNPEDSRGYIRAYFRTDEHFWSLRTKEIFPADIYLSSPTAAASFLAGLFDADGNWDGSQKRVRLSSKHEGFLRGVSRLLEQYGILAGVSKNGTSTFGKAQTYQLVVMSEYMTAFKQFVPSIRIQPDLTGYRAHRPGLIKVLSVEEDGIEAVYCANVNAPEHSFQAEGVIISNCTEVTSYDDSDVCNLGSINLARITSLAEMTEVVELATAFLMAGTVYSDVPFAKVDIIRGKNRRLGLGLMGLHEWLLTHGKKYGPDAELEQYLNIYATSGAYAKAYARKWHLSVPAKTRAIAPVGTIGICGETTTGIEPIICAAYKRRYLKGMSWHYQYVVDPTAKRLMEAGVPEESIEDAYSLAEDVERRVAFQAWVQEFVDHGISSTINLPKWGSEINNDLTVKKFGDIFIKYLPKLRGLTVYPDGARGGQPINPVKLSTALKNVGEIFVEAGDICDLTKGGKCGE